ncbi:uncharacterized protein C8Q71DRAFT_300687 [Rhodofomes roseus]|uniref:C2H2-type domain-containing protein n=1 Tax=Rhodofomes roseus TaxID=34475 RepID=A0ABQ8K3C3_9APHY|nr:uncharacterized protein C8Q71DRAFT_300687 [Rhodofomes roseus]KAH9831371.1 hypothetical protein C8Q71DRAFT_300687 [Rhodofomes roseus]
MSATHLTPYYEDDLAPAALDSSVSEAYTRPGLLDNLCEGFVDPYRNQTGMFGALSAGPSLFELPDADLDALIHGLCDPYSTSVPCPDSLMLAADTVPQLQPAHPSPTFAEDRSLWHNALPGPCTYGSPRSSAVDMSQSPVFYYSDETAYSSPFRERSSTMDLFSTLPPDPSPELFFDSPGAGSSSATCHDVQSPTSVTYQTAPGAPSAPANESPKKRANSTSGTSPARRKRTPRSSVVPYSRTSRVRTTSPRNKQVGFVPSAEPVAHEELSACSYCPFSTKRKGDLERHVRTHFALSRGQEWVCCGVPEEDALELTRDSYEYGSRRMVGGCLKSFSRHDSYLRHLKKARCLRPAHL